MKSYRGIFSVAASFIAAFSLPAAADVVQFAVERKSPVQDGVIDAGEYGAFVPYMYDASSGGGTGELAYSDRSPKSHFAWDDEFLYVAMESECANPKASHAERDGALWEDDSVELYVMHNDLKASIHQFIFNSAGAIYDSRDRKKEWNSDGVKVANRVDGGKWIFETAVPWRNFGFTPDTCVHAPHVNLCRNYATTSGEAVRFIDGGAVESVCLGRGGFAKRETMPLVFLREKVGKVEFPELRSPGAGGKASERIVSLREPGEGGKLVFWGRYSLVPKDPVSFRFITTDIPRQRLKFRSDNNISGSARYSIRLDFRDIKDMSRSVLKLSCPAAAVKGPAEQEFDVSALPEGEYRVNFAIEDSDGKVVTEDFAYYGRYPAHPPWENCSAGAEDEVPSPWTKPSFCRDSFCCWGRTVRFGGGGMVSSVVSQGRELLASPVRLVASGVPVALKVSKFEPHVSFADYVLESDDGFTVKVRAEFDGYMWFDVTRPAGEFASLSVEIPLARDCVAGFDDGHSAIDKLPLGAGKEGTWWFDPRRTPFAWMGDALSGMMAGTESLRGWHLRDKSCGYRLSVGPDAATFAVNFIDTPVKSAGPVSVGFYLNPTPVRPKNRALERFDRTKLCRWTGNVAEFFDMKKPGSMLDDKIAKFVERRRAGEKVFWYGGSAVAAPYSPLWAWYGNEWNFTGDPATVYIETDPNDREKRDRGGWVWGCLNDRSFFDFKIWSSSWFLNRPEHGVYDLYFDISFPKACANACHGCRRTDEFGAETKDYFFRPMREFHKRMYRQLKRKNPDGAMSGHVRFVRTPADNFFDAAFMGEAYEREVADKHNYYDILSPESMQIHYGDRANDMIVWMSVQIYRTYQVYCPKLLKSYNPHDTESDRAIRHAAAYFKIHNLQISVRPDESGYLGDQWWRAESAPLVCGDEPRFSAYFTPGCPVSVDVPDRLFLYAVYTGGGKAVMVLLNDTDAEVSKRIFASPAALGVANSEGREIFGRGKFSLADGSFGVTLGPRESLFIEF